MPDNSITGTYHDSARDCSYIIHVAWPLATLPGDLTSQAIAGNKAILEAAEATPSVKRVVFTGSMASIRPFERLLATNPSNMALMAGNSDGVPALTAETKVPTESPVPDDAPGFERYNHSKIAATNLVHEYAASHPNSHFSLVNILPEWVLGPEELARNKQEAFKGSNMILGWLFQDLKINPLLGLPNEVENPSLAEMVHLDDVTEGHVNALNTEKVPGHCRSFLLCSHGPTGPVWADAEEIVRRNLAQEVADGKIPFAGKLGRPKDLMGGRVLTH